MAPRVPRPRTSALASSFGSQPRAMCVGNASSPVAATRAAPSAANSAEVRGHICTRGMEPGPSGGFAEIRRDRHQASSPRILAPSWKRSKRRHRSIGVSPLKPPLLGDFLSSFVHTVFE
jgi:hypothetical protein